MKKDRSYFWPSFTDLMTTLFFVMLVLYVLTFIKLKIQQRATEAQLAKILEIQDAVKQLDTTYFSYDSVYKRYQLKRKINFPKGEPSVNALPADDLTHLIQVGSSIKKLVENLEAKSAGKDIKYVLIIEGMASKDNYPDNDILSYRRALSLKNYWKDVARIPDTSMFEIQVSGSGTGGIGRYPSHEEEKNQQILIQIIPKIGKI
ncbi:MAG TPA: hypothetical protein PKW80_00660 [Bacteroidales bacterium]|nr:hypothetical protein [Bacteroidales bacterium]